MTKKLPKKRVDELLVLNGLAEDIESARKLILAGKVRISENHVIQKPSEVFDIASSLFVDSGKKYVSRGAYKLETALDKYLPDMSGIIALDVGASTGGFTDLMLQRGAAKVYAVDAGRGQLHFKLQNDSRVISLEKCNAKSLDQKIIPEKVSVVTMDVSFISVTAILPAINKIAADDCWAFILVKPQFEAKKEEVGKGGVVTNSSVRERCVQKVKNFLEQNLGWNCLDAIPSPILGPKGNQEYILVAKKPRV